jgi:hypothetical protein
MIILMHEKSGSDDKIKAAKKSLGGSAVSSPARRQQKQPSSKNNDAGAPPARSGASSRAESVDSNGVETYVDEDDYEEDEYSNDFDEDNNTNSSAGVAGITGNRVQPAGSKSGKGQVSTKSAAAARTSSKGQPVTVDDTENIMNTNRYVNFPNAYQPRTVPGTGGDIDITSSLLTSQVINLCLADNYQI